MCPHGGSAASVLQPETLDWLVACSYYMLEESKKKKVISKIQVKMNYTYIDMGIYCILWVDCKVTN